MFCIHNMYVVSAKVLGSVCVYASLTHVVRCLHCSAVPYCTHLLLTVSAFHELGIYRQVYSLRGRGEGNGVGGMAGGLFGRLVHLPGWDRSVMSSKSG